MAEPSDKPVKSALAATSWALLGMLSYEEEVSGYDLKKWIDWSVDLYYWSPSNSQIYTELKKLQSLGLVTSRIERDEGTRSRRLYKITAAGLDAVTDWTNNAPVDPPVLKHSVLMRVTFGHLTTPARLKEMLQDHVAYAEARHRKAVEDAEGAEDEPAWAYSVLALRWAAKYYAAEREFALELMKEIDEADGSMQKAKGGSGKLRPTPGYWREVEKQVQAKRRDD
ncbi:MULTISPECIES: PadR family transcriptional regulator [unclassified Mycobacterium]|uniref:PadR family transcriptional regulator n=1 Tax=unclassified Mycobacterium TaxID=2642494 RepID=UPI000801BEB5|nr:MULTISPECIES: PadR family transcriptional regulator [unclassified Mycobacterium]OBG49250.1 PadR family transcriptional regulator [Mycobacterium sp. E735]OBG63885.1 PadR family transcriptional regulator [Mycobacterium sp. E188]OBG77460.1 PadR family transcriptional regulator [Mycobacterium sp. E3305]OBG95281.1 PadR family transcriptional regulator [Mycobacterium sp. E3298]OBG96808.1 PadR family transcriptional regulator [Mycobacterium sp. E3251]